MRIIVITGASDGIGEALTRKLSQTDTVIALARNKEKLAVIADETGAEYIVCDVRDADSVRQAFDQIAALHGTIDVLINNAGVIVNGDLTETNDEIISNVITTNTIGAMYVAKYALKAMKKSGTGLIVNVVSQAGLIGRAGRSVYNASKWAITGFTKAIQEEASEYGVRVTGFYPGTIKTDLFKKAGLQINTAALETENIVEAIEYILAQPSGVLIPTLEIKPR